MAKEQRVMVFRHPVGLGGGSSGEAPLHEVPRGTSVKIGDHSGQALIVEVPEKGHKATVRTEGVDGSERTQDLRRGIGTAYGLVYEDGLIGRLRRINRQTEIT